MYDATRAMDLNYGQIMDYIDNLPSVTPQEPKTGHWVGIDEYPHEDYECDNCGFIHTFIDGHTAQYNYCPNCGAKMVEPQKSEDKK
jgi:predicted RNA-binding Zn-ribbon protein involved in translation (DUF1610 family)